MPLDDEPIKYPVGPGQTGATRDAVVQTLVKEYQMDPKMAVELAARFAGGAPDEGVQSVAMQRVAEREQERMRKMKMYSGAKLQMMNGGQVSPALQKFVEQVDAQHKASVQAQGRDAAGRADTARTSQPVGTRVDMGGQSYYVAPPAERRVDPITQQPTDRDFEAVPPSQDEIAQRRQSVEQRYPGAQLTQGGTAVRMPAFTQEDPVYRTAMFAMKQLGVDPQRAAQFAMQLHGQGQ